MKHFGVNVNSVISSLIILLGIMLALELWMTKFPFWLDLILFIVLLSSASYFKVKGFSLVITLALAAIIFPWYFMHNSAYSDMPMTNFILEYFAVLLSSLSIIFVVVTIILQRRQLQDSNNIALQSIKIQNSMYDNEVMSIINEFLSQDMLLYRNRCEKLRERLRYDRDATYKSMKFAFERQIRDDYHKNVEWRKFKKRPSDDEESQFELYAAFNRLARYFDMVSHYDLSPRTSKAIHFYYVWWRSFLCEMIDIYHDASRDIAASDRHLSFDPNWVAMIERLDAQLSKNNLPLK